ncbi:MAG: HslU--HslV peptidase ATPase subunit, partial [Ignavibacteriales bacterium]
EVMFKDQAIEYIAQVACEVNARTENIGARRLHTILEKVLDDLLFDAPERSGEKLVIDESYVKTRLAPIVGDDELSRYIL